MKTYSTQATSEKAPVYSNLKLADLSDYFSSFVTIRNMHK